MFVVDPAIWPEYRCKREILEVFNALRQACRQLQLKVHELRAADKPLDIWIRDWGFVENAYFNYNPSYAKSHYGAAATAQAREKLNRLRCTVPRRIPLVLDGGNLVHNGTAAISTEKVFRDNPHLTRHEVEAAILSIGFQQVCFIPVEPDDGVGHADGVVKFLDAHTLLVNDYREHRFRSYRNKLMRSLEMLRVNIVPFPWFSTDERRGQIWSAVGCYINFILTKRGIIYPTFCDSRDEYVGALLGTLTKIPVIPVAARSIARLGGVLNCIVCIW
jgi:agmatine deiminase